MNFKKLWNNRIFRTFLETVLGTISAYFIDYAFELNSKKVTCIVIIAVSTGFSKILPLLKEEEKIKEEVQENNG